VRATLVEGEEERLRLILASAEHIESATSRSSQHALTCGQLVRPHQPNNEQGAPKGANTGIRVGLNSKSIPQKTALSKKMAGLMTAPWQARGDSARFSLRLKRGSPPPSPSAPLAWPRVAQKRHQVSIARAVWFQGKGPGIGQETRASHVPGARGCLISLSWDVTE
jgi:hypothetical protein